VNELQRTEAVKLLGEGATLAETRGMIGAGRDFELEWTTGKRDAEDGVESGLGAWYLLASAARLRIRAELRAEAVECAGEKRSGDLLSVVRALEAEDEPVALSADTPDSRINLADVSQETQMELHAVFSKMPNRPPAAGRRSLAPVRTSPVGARLRWSAWR
jgi:hypothetical protein